jgi:hypothetical protein
VVHIRASPNRFSNDLVFVHYQHNSPLFERSDALPVLSSYWIWITRLYVEGRPSLKRSWEEYSPLSSSSLQPATHSHSSLDRESSVVIPRCLARLLCIRIYYTSLEPWRTTSALPLHTLTLYYGRCDLRQTRGSRHRRNPPWCISSL